MMNKKITLITMLLMFLAFSNVFAQKKAVRQAKRDLAKEDYLSASKAIKPATKDDKTKDRAETWYVMGNIYMKLAHQDSLNAKGESYRDTAFNAYKKVLEIDEKYNQMLISSYLPFRQLYQNYWAYGVNGFNNEDYKAAYHGFSKVLEEVKFTKKLEINPLPEDIDTMVMLNMGNAAYRAEMTDSAVKYYQKVVDMGYDEQSFVYKILLQAYQDDNEDKFFATMKKARELFPDDEDLPQMEINYYRMHDEVDKMVEKLEKEVKNNPDDYAKTFNLAHAFDNLANKQRDSSYTGPDNQDELFNKAVKYYKKAIDLKPEEYGPNFNLGLLYYNAAAHTEADINQLSKEEREAGMEDTLAEKEDKYLDMALPYLKEAFETLDSKPTLDNGEMTTYKNAISGLQGIYARQDKSDEYDKLEKKLDEADSKLED